MSITCSQVTGSLSWTEAVRTWCSGEDDYPHCTPQHAHTHSVTHQPHLMTYGALWGTPIPPTLCNWERLCLSDGSLGNAGDVGRGMDGDTWRREGWWAWRSTRDRHLKDTSLAINQSFVGSRHPFCCLKSIMWKEQGMPLTGWCTGALWACTQ